MTPEEQSERVEHIAATQHEIWAHWMEYLFGLCTINIDGSATIPAVKVQRWRRQMATPYSELTFAEQMSDRDQAYKVLRAFSEVQP